jgi:quercetin dioxygenase-like cupin family protein
MNVHPVVDAADLETMLPALLERDAALPPGTLVEVAARLAGAGERLRALDRDPRGVRLLAGANVEARLVGWEVGRTTRAHDHGGALAAWAVVDGELVEDQFDAPVWLSGPRRRRVAAGTAVALPPGQVHVLANPGPRRALGVHVVSPPRRARLHPVGAASLLAEAVPWDALAASGA